jgi:cytoskeletal protein RodZ
VLGEFAGFKLECRSTLADKVTLRGVSEYVANVSPPESASEAAEIRNDATQAREATMAPATRQTKPAAPTVLVRTRRSTSAVRISA